MCFPLDYNDNIQHLAFVQYSFDRNEHPIDIPPHGNSKHMKNAFRRTKPSTLKLMKNMVTSNNRPLKVLRDVENMRGGVMHAKLSCDLPRNRRQVYNLKSAVKVDEGSSSNSGILRSDTLAQIMNTCKQTCSSSDAFIRSVEAAPEPMCVLSTDQQLADLERFCMGAPSSVLSIDPTFNLGPFNVTPTTFHNLLVENSNGQKPIVLGPVLIHQTKTFRPFHYFASTLIRLNPKLVGLKSFGTDGEPELIKAFEVCFPSAIHLRCTNHIRQNVKEKLSALGIPQSAYKEFLNDIFGVQRGSHFEAGLIDASSEASFMKAMSYLKEKWNNLEKSCISHSSHPQFYSFFSKYKAPTILKCVLPEVRKKAGIDPKLKFTTNISESINKVIKSEVEWKESKLPVLIDHLKTITEQHISELEKAVIERGEWHFIPSFGFLKVLDATWFSMEQGAKEKHMKKVLTCKVEVASTEPSASMRTTSSVSVPVEKCGLKKIAQSTLSGIWEKADSLLKSEGSIVRAPWISDDKARLVQSSSSPHPHIVKTYGKKQLYCCDEKCLMYKGFSLCSHVIAVAQHNGDLRAFLANLNDACEPNLTAIACQGLPTGIAGRKGGVPKRKRKGAAVIESRSVRPCLEQSRHVDLQYIPSSDPSSSNATSGPSAIQQCAVTSASLHHGASSVLSSQQYSRSLASGSASKLTTTPSTRQQKHAFLSPPLVSQASPSATGMLNPPVSAATSLPITQPLLSPATYSYAPVSQASRGQLVVGTGVNVSIGSPSFPTSSPSLQAFHVHPKPFILKLKTKQIRICQSCRQDYEGENDTLGLVVAHAERRIISNPATGLQFLGKEGNSHYHARMNCIRLADQSFKGQDLVIPEDLKLNLTIFQKFYIATIFKVQC